MSLHATARRVGGLVIAAVAASAVIGVAPAAAAPPVSPSPLNYVNLGDSYSAGSGVSPTDGGSPQNCQRSSADFAHLIAKRYGYRLTDVSCGGAKTEDFFAPQHPGVPPQLDALGPQTDLVTFMIGGNDGMIFAGTVVKCVAAAVGSLGQGSPCKDTYGDSISRDIRTQTYPKLVRAMRAVRAKAPNARVAVLGYPHIMPSTYEPCPGFPVAPGDMSYTYGIENTLNDALEKAADVTGVTYIDVATASTGHDSCKPVGVRWVEPLIPSVQPVPVHPNALGEKRMAEIAGKVLQARSA